MKSNDNFFSILSGIDCSKYIQKRNSLDYLPWAVAWRMLKEHYPFSYYEVCESQNGLNYFNDGRTGYVKVTLTLCVPKDDGTLQELKNTEMLAIMNYSHKSIPLEEIKSTDVINTIQRCLVKCAARFGLGIAIYGAADFDDLPSEEEHQQKVVDLTDIRSRLEVAIKAKTKDMSKAAKVQFLDNVVTPALNGERNWRLCENTDLLMNLLAAVEQEAA